MLKLKSVFDLSSPEFDCIIAISDSISTFSDELSSISSSLMNFKEFNPKLESTLLFIPFDKHPSKRLIFSPIESLDDDYDDSRRLYEASHAGVQMAIDMGLSKPLLVYGNFKTWPTIKPVWGYQKYMEINLLLGAMFATYVPIEIREDLPNRAKKLKLLGVHRFSTKSIEIAAAFEEGRRITRDIGGSDPERMAAPRIVEFITKEFDNTNIKITIDKVDPIKYPLMAAVNRAASIVPRHEGRVIKFEYDSRDVEEETIFLIGKGITYDSGGANIKLNGNMVGMHRDKSGAATIAGLFKILHLLKPKKLKVIGFCAFVRNSIGEESYVADEIITSRAKKRVRVNNTDAEGRMIMADLLCEAKEMAINATNPALFTIATLTGHVRLTYGLNYTAIMGNGNSCEQKIPQLLQEAGELFAEPSEISTIRREDMAFHQGYREYEDVIQCSNGPSVGQPRGHQSPAAFLILASGLDNHSNRSDKPIPYTHLDIAGSGGKIGAFPTAIPLLTFAGKYVLPRLL